MSIHAELRPLLTADGAALQRSGRTLTRAGGSTGQHAGAVGRRAVAPQWTGAASLMAESRAGRHRLFTLGVSQGLLDTGGATTSFGDEVVRLQNRAKPALRRYDSIERELLQRLRTYRLDCSIDGRPATDAVIADLRRRLKHEEGTLRGCVNDLVTARRGYYQQISDRLPPEVLDWWRKADEFKDDWTAIKDGVRDGRAAVGYLRALGRYGSAMSAGDPVKAAAALRRMAQARGALLPKGPAARSQKLPGFRKVWSSKLGRMALRKVGPAGVVDIAYQGGKDALGDSPHSGAREAGDRGTGALAVGGAAAIALGAPGIGWAAIAVWAAWKAGNAIYDSGQRQAGHAARLGQEPRSTSSPKPQPTPQPRPTPSMTYPSNGMPLDFSHFREPTDRASHHPGRPVDSHAGRRMELPGAVHEPRPGREPGYDGRMRLPGAVTDPPSVYGLRDWLRSGPPDPALPEKPGTIPRQVWVPAPGGAR